MFGVQAEFGLRGKRSQLLKSLGKTWKVSKEKPPVVINYRRKPRKKLGILG